MARFGAYHKAIELFHFLVRELSKLSANFITPASSSSNTRARPLLTFHHLAFLSIRLTLLK